MRVPVESFFSLRDAIKGLASPTAKGQPNNKYGAIVTSMSDQVDDVTSQFVDASSRAATLQASHRQLVLLMEKADTVDSVLKVSWFVGCQ